MDYHSFGSFVNFVLLKISEVVFQWIPATVSVLTNQELPKAFLQDMSKPTIILTSKLVHDMPQTVSSQLSQVSSAVGSGASIQNTISSFWHIFVPVSIFLSLLMCVGIIYSIIRIRQIRLYESHIFSKFEKSPITSSGQTSAQNKWEKIVEQSLSDNQSEWRLAIIEADIMLKELLYIQGYKGKTMSDQMKQVERSDFRTIDLAWEAHKIRNKIAHEGSEHMLNEREIKRVIGLYKQVFMEFHFI